MPFTLGQLKFDVRQQLWPQGEARNLVPRHDRDFVDCLVDLQTHVDCLQQDNNNVIDQCATFYKCGITVLEAPRGIVKSLSVVDRINPDTHKEDPESPIDWCSDIHYREIDFCHVSAYFAASQRRGCCLPIPLFFGLTCSKGLYPIPTDEGVPKSLPALPLGYHYPQTSTDRTYGRAQQGFWAKDRGKIYIVPWLQSTETVLIKWDGIKRTWADADLIDDDPLLQQAVFEYMRWKHADRWDKDEAEAARAQAAYVGAPGTIGAREMLIHQCREETRARACEGSNARSSPLSITNLFYNDEQSASATCPDGTSGSSVSVTIPAGTVASGVSVADANQKAKAQASAQATSQLDCADQEATFTNDAQTATASCQGSGSAPPPEGQPVTVTIPAGTVESTVSKADANAQALALAETQAAAELTCTFWNSAQTYTATCANNNPAGNVTKTIAPHTYSSTFSQADADAQALNAAKAQAETALSPTCSGAGVFVNTQQIVTITLLNCITPLTRQRCAVSMRVTIGAGIVTSTVSQADANLNAQNLGRQIGTGRAQIYCSTGQCGTYDEFFG
jgi:hypothetical protein